MALDDVPRLGCGRSIDSIWATIERPPTAHEEQCDHCQTARTRLERLSEETRALRESDVHDPALKPGPGIKDAIMDVARAEVRRGSRILLRSADNGTTEISEQALSSLVRFAAAAIPGVHSRRCRIEIRPAASSIAGEDDPSGTAGNATTAGPRLIVNLRVAAAPGIDIPLMAEVLRHEISNAIPAGVGIGAGTVNITVEDLYDV
ncbi:putative alkaline shock family protein YloU [Pseudarthrobacter oxydans]|uniref:Asp23/Gls24 family envelope stress response protein n=1 Tax=Pseudarthrobacter oxydans TaxID=1671 RepID=UPI0027894FDE|nr:Asp23/Gls24 family envelope stress response protein [Pseudarthrobacter oxydans]MDP9984462.1 putative alkaline shock family protein YloU [Pseudarthrobacter oxydans]